MQWQTPNIHTQQANFRKVMDIRNKRYRGDGLLSKQKFPYKDRDGIVLKDSSGKVVMETIPPYITNKKLVDAIALTRFLKRPLLIKGEPGCGKTRFAQAVAYELYGADYRQYFFEWHIKSSTKAKDGLYTFDHIKRLRDAQLAQFQEKGKRLKKTGNAAATNDITDLNQYIQTGALGEAFARSTEQAPTILLIDEIDKADIDFPNDLLLELDQKRYVVEETGEVKQALYPPIIFITSNDEKELPQAFLRRCLFLYIDFPKKEILEMILDANFPVLEKQVTTEMVARFRALRAAMTQSLNTDKKVSTSELIDWAKVINQSYLQDYIGQLQTKATRLENEAEKEVLKNAIATAEKALTQKLSPEEIKQMVETAQKWIPSLNTAEIQSRLNDTKAWFFPSVLLKSLNDQITNTPKTS